MCCGLWKIKSILKYNAEQVCEHPEQSKQVFDQFITDELLYGSFSRSLLGDDSLNCGNYPEGSVVCDHLFSILFVLLIFSIILFFLIIISLNFTTYFCFRYRRDFDRLLKSRENNFQNFDEKSRFLKNSKESLNSHTSSPIFTKRRVANILTCGGAHLLNGKKTSVPYSNGTHPKTPTDEEPTNGSINDHNCHEMIESRQISNNTPSTDRCPSSASTQCSNLNTSGNKLDEQV